MPPKEITPSPSWLLATFGPVLKVHGIDLEARYPIEFEGVELTLTREVHAERQRLVIRLGASPDWTPDKVVKCILEACEKEGWIEPEPA
jgi:hypothetical protein